MGGAVSSGENNDQLVDNLINANYIKSGEVERVFRAVDRAFYYTEGDKSTAYKDLAWKNRNLHLSAPCIYSQVMESLELEEGMSFLNLGSGTGYLNTMVGLILGSSGINHGVELHQDVIDYAQEKLQTFIKENSAIDEYDFCVPQFQQGNCLSLASTKRLYNRIYCGAACPELYNDYIKQMVAVGGILVMPVNDQLLQIKRLNTDSWEVNPVLPVSFASLVVPQPDLADDVVLPAISPQSLENLCRSAIRSILRSKIGSEHPDLWECNRKNPKEVKRTVMRRCVVPLFANSDSDSDSMAYEMDANADRQQDNDTSTDDTSDHEAMVQEEEPSDRRTGVLRLAETLSDAEENGAKTKREKFDSGVSDLFESGSEGSSCPSQPSSAVDLSTSSVSAANPSSNSSDSSKNGSSDSESSVAGQNGACDEPSVATNRRERARSALSSIRLFAHAAMAGERDPPALVIFGSRLDNDDTSDTGDDEETATSNRKEEVDYSRVTPPENYTFYMKQCVMALPLPPALKSFLNYYRTF